jgi:predicted ribosome quality control (RQC) complex YloA/Tae2 family protein
MQTALHIAALVSQLKTEIVGGSLVATQFYKKLRTALFVIQKDHERQALVFVYHPAGSGCFCVPASKIRLDTNEKPWPIFGLENADIEEIIQPELDRIFEVVIGTTGGRQRLVFEALGPNGNIWLVGADGTRKGTLRNRKFDKGEQFESLKNADRLDPVSLSPEQLRTRLSEQAGRSPLAALKAVLIGFNDTLAREALVRAQAEIVHPEAVTSEQAESLTAAVKEIAERFGSVHAGYLYEVRGAAEAYPFQLKSIDKLAEKYATLSLAVMEMTSRQQTSNSDTDEEQRLMKAVGSAVKRHERLLVNVEADLAKAADFERYKRLGELLQLNRDSLKKGMKSIEVEDVLQESSVKLRIELNPAVAPNENIDEYFRRHRKGREGVELLRRRFEIAGAELEALRSMQAELETDFESARQKYQAELVSLLPREPGKKEVTPRLPYREAQLSTGLTIYIGRDGADNDRTTFEFARPYELWFHAQQCAGSHVVMKYPNKSFEPSKREIEETAAIAAWHSKARNDSSVPVAYAQRRYVRKPRNAKPGLVTVEREKSVMVVPHKEQSADK